MAEHDSYETILRVTTEETLPDIVRTLPYAKHVFAAYRWLHNFRLKRFLLGLNAAVDQLSREDRAALDRYINSELGGELLADFAEQAVRTRSKTALAALAILYAHPEADADRKAQTALDLDGISERSIDALLLLCRLRSALSATPDGIVMLSNELVADQSALSAAGWDSDAWVSILDDLLARRMLGRDLTERLGDKEWAWSRNVRFTEETVWYETLLSRARRSHETRSVMGLQE